MNLELTISAIAVLIAILSIVYSRTGFKKSSDYRQLLEFLGKRIEDLEEIVAVVRESSEADARRVSDQARRIAWLEARVRQPKIIEEEILTDENPHNSPKSIITERRYRVLTLAERGQSVEEIAATLGMMNGEVQLIINLSRMTA